MADEAAAGRKEEKTRRRRIKLSSPIPATPSSLQHKAAHATQAIANRFSCGRSLGMSRESIWLGREGGRGVLSSIHWMSGSLANCR